MQSYVQCSHKQKIRVLVCLMLDKKFTLVSFRKFSPSLSHWKDLKVTQQFAECEDISIEHCICKVPVIYFLFFTIQIYHFVFTILLITAVFSLQTFVADHSFGYGNTNLKKCTKMWGIWYTNWISPLAFGYTDLGSGQPSDHQNEVWVLISLLCVVWRVHNHSWGFLC